MGVAVVVIFESLRIVAWVDELLLARLIIVAIITVAVALLLVLLIVLLWEGRPNWLGVRWGGGVHLWIAGGYHRDLLGENRHAVCELLYGLL